MNYILTKYWQWRIRRTAKRLRIVGWHATIREGFSPTWRTYRSAHHCMTRVESSIPLDDEEL